MRQVGIVCPASLATGDVRRGSPGSGGVGSGSAWRLGSCSRWSVGCGWRGSSGPCPRGCQTWVTTSYCLCGCRPAGSGRRGGQGCPALLCFRPGVLSPWDPGRGSGVTVERGWDEGWGGDTPELLCRCPDQNPGPCRRWQGVPGPLCERELGGPSGAAHS